MLVIVIESYDEREVASDRGHNPDQSVRYCLDCCFFLGKSTVD